MKTTIFLASIFIMIMSIGCSNTKEKTAEEMLKDPKMEDEIYTAILENKTHLSKFMDRMMVDKNCEVMMSKKGPMTKMMCTNHRMDSLMANDGQTMECLTNSIIRKIETDSIACDKTCTQMMGSDRFRKHMMEHAKSGFNKMHEKK